MSIELRQAKRDDMQTIWQMQVEAFKGLLETYQDYDLSPAAEGLEKVMARFEQPWTKYFFITADSVDVGACYRQERRLKKTHLTHFHNA